MDQPESSPQAWDVPRRIAFLARVPLFRRLSPETLEAVAVRLRVRPVQDGEFIFLEGMPSEEVHLLAAGRVKVVHETEDGREVILRLIHPGDIFGAAGAWGEELYPASAIALGAGLVLQLSARAVADLIDEHPPFAAAVIRELGTRLREAESRIRDLQTQRAERRIAGALLRLANKTGVRTPAGIEIGVPLSRQNLAELSGTTLSTVSRTLSAWDRAGLIRAGRERVTILQTHGLVAIAEDLDEPSGEH